MGEKERMFGTVKEDSGNVRGRILGSERDRESVLGRIRKDSGRVIESMLQSERECWEGLEGMFGRETEHAEKDQDGFRKVERDSTFGREGEDV